MQDPTRKRFVRILLQPIAPEVTFSRNGTQRTYYPTPTSLNRLVRVCTHDDRLRLRGLNLSGTHWLVEA